MAFSLHSLRIELALFDPGAAPLDLFEVASDVRYEGRMCEESPEMTRRSRINLGEFVAEQKRESRRFEHGFAGALVVKQAQLGDEADVGKREVITDQKGAPRR
jgi:hypothetical protein